MRVRIERTADEGLPYRLVNADTDEPLIEGLFVDADFAAMYCQSRRWRIAEVVEGRPIEAVETPEAAVVPEPVRKTRGLASAKRDRKTASMF